MAPLITRTAEAIYRADPAKTKIAARPFETLDPATRERYERMACAALTTILRSDADEDAPVPA